VEDMGVMDKIKEFYRGKKVLITGHTGFKGSWLSLWLSLLKANVIGYALKPDTIPSMFEVLNLESVIEEHVVADIRNLKKLRKVIDEYRPEIIFHLAAQPIVKRSYDDPVYTFDVNVMGTVYLLEAIRSIDWKGILINITTDKVYENREWIWGYRENDPLGGGYDPYSASKVCSEIVTHSYMMSFFDKENIRIATARAGNVIGGGDWAPYRLLPDIARFLARKEEVIIRRPDAVRPWQHVLEPLWGYMLLAYRLAENKSFGGAYNFGPHPGDTLRVEDVVKLAVRIWGEGSYRVEPSSFHESSILRLDITKAMVLLGWKPTWDSVKAIEETIRWYKAFYRGEDVTMLTLKQIEEFQKMWEG